MEIIKDPVPNIFGGSIIGNLLNALCFGVLTIQTSSYYHAFPNDARSLKLAVGFLWTLEAFQLLVSPFRALQLSPGITAEAHSRPTTCALCSGCGVQSLYWWVVTNYGNPSTLGHATWELSTFQFSAVCASATVQTFFAHRVYSLSANLYLGVFVQVLVLIQFGFGAATSVKLIMLPDFEVLVKEWTWFAVAWLTIQAIADIVIAACMCVILQRRRTGFRKTDSVINRMILYTISTGLATSVLSCILNVVFSVYGIDFSVLITGMPLGAFYSVTMLANLHTRKALLARLDTPSLLEMISSSMKKRIWRKAGGGPESAGRTNIVREVVHGDVNTQQKFAWVLGYYPSLAGSTAQIIQLRWSRLFALFRYRGLLCNSGWFIWNSKVMAGLVRDWDQAIALGFIRGPKARLGLRHQSHSKRRERGMEKRELHEKLRGKEIASRAVFWWTNGKTSVAGLESAACQPWERREYSMAVHTRFNNSTAIRRRSGLIGKVLRYLYVSLIGVAESSGEEAYGTIQPPKAFDGNNLTAATFEISRSDGSASSITAQPGGQI
ncbi:hypothetical protein BS47DRAFT_1383130 [Hydnum rufescens UP504]|uniref:DUF6534 domain-containing protein n=1 Tax=Hydnum rufescens UP504 TaxID=1448309 RepID=A0A9P6AUR3_9AGAM|nr:hypothetical protein BS47DRAFT_1383130 [Hydnum rufescens UP504]